MGREGACGVAWVLELERERARSLHKGAVDAIKVRRPPGQCVCVLPPASALVRALAFTHFASSLHHKHTYALPQTRAGSYTFSGEKLREEAALRLAFLKTLQK